MNITSLLNGSFNSLQTPSSRTNDNPDRAVNSPRTPMPIPVIDLSDGGRSLLDDFQQKTNKVPVAYQIIPVGQRPSSQQSADTIINFIGGRLEALASSGADRETLESAFEQAVKGFQQGLKEAKNILQGVQMMSDEVSGGIDVTEQLVRDGLAQLRTQFLDSNQSTQTPSQPPQPAPALVSSVVNAYRQQSTEVTRYSQSTISADDNPAASNLRAAASDYAASYRRNDSIELSLRTRDGDLVTLSFSSDISTNRSSTFAGIQSENSSSAALTYQRAVSVSSNFSMTVKGELDSGEMAALNNLLAEVSAVSDEFFNGDFDKAFEMAINFEMDGKEFSTMALDINRSTRATVTESYVGLTGQNSGQSSLTSNTANLDSLVEKLLSMIEKSASFDQSQKLLTELLANSLAQRSLR